MRRLAAATPLLVAVVVLAVLWVTNAGAVPFFTGGPDHNPQPHKKQVRHRPPHGQGQPPHSKHTIDMSFLWYVSYVLLSLFLVALLAFLFSATLTNRRGRREHLVEADDVLDAIDAFDVPADLVQTTERQLQAIRRGSPRNAIVACWWELERSCAASGFPRATAETSTEFTARALGRFTLDPDMVEALAALYREARFSEHELTEPDRVRAVAALETLLAGLRTRQSSTEQKAMRA